MAKALGDSRDTNGFYARDVKKDKALISSISSNQAALKTQFTHPLNL